MADNRKYVQAQTFILAGSGAALGATSITLTSFAQIDGTLLALSNFGTKGYATIEPNNGTKEEAITFAGVTQNANGTATLTGVSNQLLISPYTETSGTTKLHAGGTKLIITNTAGFYDTFVNKNSDESITGLWDFSQFPQKTGSTTPTGANELASKAYVDSVVGGIAVTDQVLTSGTAGEALTIGKVVYLQGSTMTWLTADSSDANKSVAVKLGVAQAAAGGSGSSILVLTAGIDKNQSGLVGTSPYYLSTAGGISLTKGTNIRLVGRAQSATTLQFEDDEQSPEVQLVDGSRTYATATNPTSGSYVLTLTPAITAYKAGQTFSFLSGTTSIAGTNYLNVSGLGAKILKRLGGVENVEATDISGTQIVVVKYDGTNMQVVSPLATTVAPIGTAAQGDVTYHNGSRWTRLPAGTSTYVLTTGGAGANAAWQPNFSVVRGAIANNTDVATSGGGGTNTDTVVTHGLGTTPKILTVSCAILANNNPATAQVVGHVTMAMNSSLAILWSNAASFTSNGGVLVAAAFQVLSLSTPAFTVSGAGATAFESITVSVTSITSTQFTFRINGVLSGADPGASTVTNIIWSATG